MKKGYLGGRPEGRPKGRRRCDNVLPSRRDDEGRNRLAVEHHRLVFLVVGRFFRRHPTAARFYTRDDAFADGFLGLLRACELYDDARSRFSTYALPWIYQSLHNGYRRHGRFFQAPRHHDSPDVHLSDDMTLFDHHEAAPTASRVTDPTAEMREAVLGLLGDIPPREAGVVRMRLAGLSKAEVGEALGLSRERVRQLEKSARERLFRKIKQREE